jgi:hypothetical protein
LPYHFFNRQSAIGNENLAFGCGYAALCLGVSVVNAIDFFTPSVTLGYPAIVIWKRPGALPQVRPSHITPDDQPPTPPATLITP